MEDFDKLALSLDQRLHTAMEKSTPVANLGLKPTCADISPPRAYACNSKPDSFSPEIQHHIWEFVFTHDRQIRCPRRGVWRADFGTDIWKKECLGSQLLCVDQAIFKRHFPTLWSQNFF